MKKLSKIFALTVSVIMVLSLAACGSEPAPTQTNAPQTTQAPQTTAAPTEKQTDAPQPSEESTAAAAAAFEGPALVVSVGKSADISIAKSMMTRIKVDYDVYESESGKDIDLTGVKTVVIVPGVSTKGLGEAGIQLDEELGAARKIVEKIDAADVKVLVAHLGGSSRRDDLTDQFIDVILPIADHIVCLDEGNRDGKFTDYAAAHGVPCDSAENISGLVANVQKLFGN